MNISEMAKKRGIIYTSWQVSKKGHRFRIFQRANTKFETIFRIVRNTQVIKKWNGLPQVTIEAESKHFLIESG